MRNIRQKAKPAGLFALMFAASLLLLLAGCQNPLTQGRQPDQATGSVLLTIGGGADARTILPSAPPMANIDRLTVEVRQTEGGVVIDNEIWDGAGTLVLELTPGSWHLTVLAEVYYDDEYDLVARGTATVVVESDRNTAAPITLRPVGGGYGTFAWEITLPADVPDVTAMMLIVDLDDYIVKDWTALTIAAGVARGDYTLEAGTYFVILKLTVGDEALQLTEILRVYRNLTSLFSHEIEIEDLPVSLLGLMANAWDGTGFVDEDGDPIGINHNHFAALGIYGVTGPAFAGSYNILHWFAYHLDGEDFPNEHQALAVLVDASLVGLLTRDPVFMLSGAADWTQADAIDRIIGQVQNSPQIIEDDIEWSGTAPNWVAIVSIGDFTVVITFIADIVYAQTVAITYPVDDITLRLGEAAPVQFAAQINPADALWTIEWDYTGTDGAITLSYYGLVTAVALGEVNVRAVARGADEDGEDVYSDPITVTVIQPVTSVLITGAGVTGTQPSFALTLTMDDAPVVLEATALPDNANFPTVTWALTSGDAFVDFDSATRTLTATAAGGPATITATADDVTSTLTVMVEEPMVTITPPLYRRVFDTGGSGSIAGSYGNYLPSFGTWGTAEGLRVQGTGSMRADDFRNHFVWVAVPAYLDSFTAEIDMYLPESTFGNDAQQSMMGLFVASGDPGTLNPGQFGGFYLVREGTRLSRVQKLIGGSFYDGRNANTTTGAGPTTGTLTMRITHAVNPVTQPTRVRSTFFHNGEVLGTENMPEGSDRFTPPSGYVYVGIIVGNHNNTNPSTAVITGMRIDFGDGEGLVNIDLSTPITEWVAPRIRS